MNMNENVSNVLRFNKDALRRKSYLYNMLNGKNELLGMLDSFDYEDKVAALEEMFAKYIGAEHAILTGSGSNSLELVLDCIGIKSNTKVLLQAYTCAMLKNIIAEFATPQFVDTDLNSYNANISDIKNKTIKESVILLVHSYGNPAPIDELSDFAQEKNSIIIEDCAHALGAEYKGKKVGSFGKASIFSLRKNLAVGSGGFIVTNDDTLAKKILIKREGFEKNRFRAHDIFAAGALVTRSVLKENPMHLSMLYNLYFHNRSPHRLLTLLGVSIATEQLKQLDNFIQKTEENAKYLTKKLKNIDNLILPEVKNDVRHVYTKYPIRFRNLERHSLSEVCGALFLNGFQPCNMLYSYDFIENVGKNISEYPKSKIIADTMVPVGLPSNLKKEDINVIANIFEKFAN